MSDDRFTPWLTAARERWLGNVTTWLNRVTRERGLGAVDSIESFHERVWAAVLKVTTSEHVLYFKAQGRGGFFETALLMELGSSWPRLVPDVLAADTRRSWILMADHGSPIGEVATDEEIVSTFEQLLPMYARMQEGTVHSVDAHIAIGVPDRRLTLLPGLLDDVIAHGRIGGERLQIDDALRRGLARRRADLVDACRELARTAVPDALEHGDLHQWNVLAKDGDYRVIDWGDCTVTHPFCSLFVVLQLAVARLDSVDKIAVGRRLRNAYLEAWGTPSELAGTLDIALWVGYVIRVLDFVHQLSDADEGPADDWRHGAIDLLECFVERRDLIGRGDELIEAIVSRPVA